MLNETIYKLFAVFQSRKGVSSMEYAILAVAIIGVLTTAMATFKTDFAALFTALDTALTTAAGGTPAGT